MVCMLQVFQINLATKSSTGSCLPIFMFLFLLSLTVSSVTLAYPSTYLACSQVWVVYLVYEEINVP